MRSALFTLSILIVLSAVCGCSTTDDGSGSGNDTVAPELSSLTRSDGISLSSPDRLSGTIENATMTLVFSEAVTVPDGAVTLVCDDTSVSLALSTSDNITYTITPESNLPQYSECTLAVAAAVVDSSDNSLEGFTITFNTKCASSDEFDNQETLEGCWSAVNVPDGAVMDIDTTNPGVLTIDNATAFAAVEINTLEEYYEVVESTWREVPRIYKTVTGDFDLSVYISSENTAGTHSVGLFITASPEDPIESGLFSLGWNTTDDESILSSHNFYTYSEYFGHDDNEMGDQGDYTGTSMYMRGRRSGDTFTYYISQDGVSWTTVHSRTITDVGNTVSVNIYTSSSNLGFADDSLIDYFRFAEGNTDGQD